MAGRFGAGGVLAAATRGGGGGKIEKWGQPLRVIAQDYVEVTKDAYRDIRTRPIKSLAYALIGSSLLATWKLRPDADSYTDRILNHCNELHLCSELVRNRESWKYLENIVKKFSVEELEYKSMGLFAVVLERESSPVCQNYHTTCKYVRRRWWDRLSRVVDVGFWGRWWALDRAMVNYDVNEEELAHWLEQQKKI